MTFPFPTAIVVGLPKWATLNGLMGYHFPVSLGITEITLWRITTSRSHV